MKKDVKFTDHLYAFFQLKHMHVNQTLARMVPHVSILVTSTHVSVKKVLKASTANMT